MKYYCDDSRHLVCIPYSIANLHEMAIALDIKRCWFHLNHYDIPKRRIKEVTDKCKLVTSQEIVRIIKMKPIIKFNGGIGAILCNKCRTIIKDCLTDEEFKGKTDLLICEKCENEK